MKRRKESTDNINFIQQLIKPNKYKIKVINFKFRKYNTFEIETSH